MTLFHKKTNDRFEDLEADEIDVEGPVIIAGIGRFGQIVNRLVQGYWLQNRCFRS